MPAVSFKLDAIARALRARQHVINVPFWSQRSTFTVAKLLPFLRVSTEAMTPRPDRALGSRIGQRCNDAESHQPARGRNTTDRTTGSLGK
jgi:hypothetical protein